MAEQDLCERCGRALEGVRRDARTCSTACRSALYRQRRRVARDRLAEHEETQRIARHFAQHRAHWVEWFVHDAGLSRKQADRLYVRLIESGRLPSPGQMTLDQYL